MATTYQLYCGNFEYEASEREVERLFERYGRVERVDMKTGFAFIYMRDKRDAEDAIRGLDGREFGYKKRRLKVELAKSAASDRPPAALKPTNTLFVVNFDRDTTEREVERAFERYGRIIRCQIKKTFAFVQFGSEAEAGDALKAMDGAKLHGRTLKVEFGLNDEAKRFASGAMDREPPAHKSRSRSRSRAGRSRSRSPVRRNRSRSLSRGGRSKSPRLSPVRSPVRSPAPRSASPVRKARSPSASPVRNKSRSRSPVRGPSRERSPRN